MNKMKKNMRKAKREAREAQQMKRATKTLFGALVLLVVLGLVAFIVMGYAC